MLDAPPEARGLALRGPAWSGSTRVSVNNDPERAGISPGYHVLRRPWRKGDVVTVHLDLTPRWTCPDRRVDAIRGCVAIERGPLVYCFEQADQLDGAQLDNLVVKPGGYRRAARHPGRDRPDDRDHRGGPAPARGYPGHGHRDPVLPVGQPRRRADARLDAEGFLRAHAVQVLQRELVQVLVGQPAWASASVSACGSRTSRQVSPGSSVGEPSWSTPEACKAAVTSGSARNARTLARRIR